MDFVDFRRAMCRVCDIMDLRSLNYKVLRHEDAVAIVDRLYSMSPFAHMKGRLGDLTRGELCMKLYDLARFYGYEHDPCVRPNTARIHYYPISPEQAYYLVIKYLVNQSDAIRTIYLTAESDFLRFFSEQALPQYFFVPIVRTAISFAGVVPEEEIVELGMPRNKVIDLHVRRLAVLLSNQPKFVTEIRQILRR